MPVGTPLERVAFEADALSASAASRHYDASLLQRSWAVWWRAVATRKQALAAARDELLRGHRAAFGPIQHLIDGMQGRFAEASALIDAVPHTKPEVPPPRAEEQGCNVGTAARSSPRGCSSPSVISRASSAAPPPSSSSVASRSRRSSSSSSSSSSKSAGSSVHSSATARLRTQLVAQQAVWASRLATAPLGDSHGHQHGHHDWHNVSLQQRHHTGVAVSHLASANPPRLSPPSAACGAGWGGGGWERGGDGHGVHAGRATPMRNGEVPASARVSPLTDRSSPPPQHACLHAGPYLADHYASHNDAPGAAPGVAPNAVPSVAPDAAHEAGWARDCARGGAAALFPSMSIPPACQAAPEGRRQHTFRPTNKPVAFDAHAVNWPVLELPEPKALSSYPEPCELRYYVGNSDSENSLPRSYCPRAYANLPAPLLTAARPSTNQGVFRGGDLHRAEYSAAKHPIATDHRSECGVPRGAEATWAKYRNLRC